MTPRGLDAGEREERRPSRGAHPVINASYELTDREKRVYLADLFWWQGPEGSWISAPNLGKRLGLSGEAVEGTRRALVEAGLQIVFDRPAGRTNGRICILPQGTDPGDGATPEEAQAAAILLDGYLRRKRGPAAATPPGEGSGRVAGRDSMVAPPLPPATRDTRGVARGSGEDIQGSGRVARNGISGGEKATSRYPESGGVAQGSAEDISGSEGGVGGGALNPPNLQSKSLSSLKLEKIEGKREGSIDPQEERGGPGEREGSATPRKATPPATSATPVNWRDIVPRPDKAS